MVRPSQWYLFAYGRTPGDLQLNRHAGHAQSLSVVLRVQGELARTGETVFFTKK